MNRLRISTGILFFMGFILFASNGFSQNPNFYIYLCFGQSNMEGQGTIETQDKTVDSRFKVMEAVACSGLGRTKGNWYTAAPPLSRCYTGLCPVDYFGRTMVANLPDSIQVGIINVSVAGCKIELFQKDEYKTYVSSITEDWLKNIIKEYNNNPYGYLVELAKKAQLDGVIKGFLLHQGESNTGDSQWPAKVKSIYDNLIADLSLDPASTPLLAGEVVNADQGGACASMNNIIAKLPNSIPNAYVISSKGCTDAADNIHFNSAGYREIGQRYGAKMLSLLGYDVIEPEDPQTPAKNVSVYYEPECATVGANWNIVTDTNASNEKYVEVKSGTQSLSEAASIPDGAIVIPFSIDSTGTYRLHARLNCPNADDDSFWVRMDNGDFALNNGLATSGWQWMTLNSYDLTQGEHTLTMTYREDGAKLDKICISTDVNVPTGMGEGGLNVCVADTSTVGVDESNTLSGYSLGQNYPNPFNGKTNISFEIPDNSYVSLKVFNMLGVEIAELAGKDFIQGKHLVEFDSQTLSKGIYFYILKAGSFSASHRMMIKSE